MRRTLTLPNAHFQDSFGPEIVREEMLEASLPDLLALLAPQGAPALHGVDWHRSIDFPIPVTGQWRGISESLRPMLAPTWPPRLDGRPSWHPRGRSGRWTALMGPHADTCRREACAAIACDLCDRDPAEISEWMLGFPLSYKKADGDPRKARLYRQQGRRLLADLGAWPWTHADDGRLPRDWRADPAFAGPLWAWHDGARAESAGAVR